MRYQQHSNYLQSQIEDLQKNITDQQTQSEVNIQTAAQHAEVMEKVQKLNELAEANKILTSEKESAEETVRELVTKVCWAFTLCVHFIYSGILAHWTLYQMAQVQALVGALAALCFGEIPLFLTVHLPRHVISTGKLHAG